MVRFSSGASQEGFGFFEQTFRVFSRLCGGYIFRGVNQTRTLTWVAYSSVSYRSSDLHSSVQCQVVI